MDTQASIMNFVKKGKMLRLRSLENVAEMQMPRIMHRCGCQHFICGAKERERVAELTPERNHFVRGLKRRTRAGNVCVSKQAPNQDAER